MPDAPAPAAVLGFCPRCAAPVYGKRVYGSQWEAQQGAFVALEWAKESMPRIPRWEDAAAWR